ncbi:MAG: ABC transporter permease [Pseudomonadota bacterium]
MVWSLVLSLVIATVGLIIGTIVGLVAARSGRIGDFVLMRATDSVFAFPERVAAVAFAGLFGPSTKNLVIALSIVSWMKFTRLARSLAHGLDARDFVIQARLNGLPPLLILWRHILPNAIPPLLVLWTNSWSRTILAVSGLSFLGLGVQPPTAEWGAMLLDGKPHMQTSPHIMIFPGLAVLISVLLINLGGDRLRDLVAAQDAAWGRHPPPAHPRNHLLSSGCLREVLRRTDPTAARSYSFTSPHANPRFWISNQPEHED